MRDHDLNVRKDVSQEIILKVDLWPLHACAHMSKHMNIHSYIQTVGWFQGYLQEAGLMFLDSQVSEDALKSLFK